MINQTVINSYLLPGVLVTLKGYKQATILTGGIVNNEIRTSKGQYPVTDITHVEHYHVRDISKMVELKTGLTFQHMITGYKEIVTDVCKRPVSEHITIEVNKAPDSVNPVSTEKQHIAHLLNGQFAGVLKAIQ